MPNAPIRIWVLPVPQRTACRQRFDRKVGAPDLAGRCQCPWGTAWPPGRAGLCGRQDRPQIGGGYLPIALKDEKVDLLLAGYGNNSISPAMPLVMEHEKYFVGLMG